MLSSYFLTGNYLFPGFTDLRVGFTQHDFGHKPIHQKNVNLLNSKWSGCYGLKNFLLKLFVEIKFWKMLEVPRNSNFSENHKTFDFPIPNI